MVRASELKCRVQIALALMIICGASVAHAVAKPHLITFGKWTTVSWSPGLATTDDKPLTLKVRPLLIDARVKEFTFGPVHEVTDRLFVVRRAFRVNDSLPQESASPPHWEWQRSGWLLVDRVTGHVSPINLPEFDAFYSGTSWYRDYVAYCGVSEDGKRVYAVVEQISRRRPVLKKLLDGQSVAEGDGKSASSDSACPVPLWQRSPTRVTFELAGVAKQTFVIRGHVVDLMTEEDDDEDAAK